MKKNEKRKTILCSVNEKKENMNEVSKKKKFAKIHTRKKITKKKSRKKNE